MEGKEQKKNVEKDADSIKESAEAHSTVNDALIVAVKEGNKERVIELTETQGADVNAIDKDEYTSLMLAAKKGHDEIIKFLIVSGADVNMISCSDTAVRIAAYLGHDKCVVALMQAGADVNLCESGRNPPVVHAATQDHATCLKQLIDGGADVNARSSHYETPLIYAASRGRLGNVEELIKAGADLNLFDDRGFTPLIVAAEKGHVNCVNALLKAGSNVNWTGSDGETALMMAVYHSNPECIEALIKSGADVNRGPHYGRAPPVVSAAYIGHYKCLELLVQGGVDIHVITNYDGRSAFMTSCISNIRCSQLLLREGARINIRNIEGTTAIEDYLESGAKKEEQKSDVLKLLFVAGETLEDSTITKYKDELPDLLKEVKTDIHLKHVCREAIRKHLIALQPHAHLFGRIPLLGIPSPLTSYLLYQLTLNEDYQVKDPEKSSGVSCSDYYQDHYYSSEDEDWI